MPFNFPNPLLIRNQFLLTLSILARLTAPAQENTDSTTARNILPEIKVKAFEQNRNWREIPAAVNLVSNIMLNRFSPISIVQAVNSTPGVRMEERSPGSYRFNIRGSSLRSPFGVRNVKVYFNDIPITDPGGQTYLNQLGFYNFQSLEIIKGPGSSLYGAGTGGVLLIQSQDGQEKAGAFAAYTGGSFGLHQVALAVITGKDNKISKFSFQRQNLEGYRNHSSLQRDVFGWTGSFHFDQNKILKTSFLYGDHYYETPGALTLAEYEANPKSARPGTGGFPGAVSARASIRQRSFLAGASYEQQFNEHWLNKSVLYGMFTSLRNPAIRNYGQTGEPHVGGRTIFRFRHSGNQLKLQWDLGAEWQEGFSTVQIYKNNSGSPDSLQSHDDINNHQSFLFTQAVMDAGDWLIMAGLSYNWMRVGFQRFTPATSGLLKRRFDNQIAPRISVLKKMGTLNLYTAVSRGFSPPTTSELLPTGSAINLSLSPEEGTSYEMGIKGNLAGKLYMDINAFIFSLRNTIVQRRDAGGGDYFLNAGRTQQRGVETQVQLPLILPGFLEQVRLFASHTWHHFYYREFKPLNNDFSGNRLPGTSPHSIAAGAELEGRHGLSMQLHYYYAGKIALNDANTSYAVPYHLAGIKMGYEKKLPRRWLMKLQAGADNLFNQEYSLGNDLNGFGGRYYNAAPTRNFFASVILEWGANPNE